jgi:hypothetical protein
MHKTAAGTGLRRATIAAFLAGNGVIGSTLDAVALYLGLRLPSPPDGFDGTPLPGRVRIHPTIRQTMTTLNRKIVRHRHYPCASRTETTIW